MFTLVWQKRVHLTQALIFFCYSNVLPAKMCIRMGQLENTLYQKFSKENCSSISICISIYNLWWSLHKIDYFDGTHCSNPHIFAQKFKHLIFIQVEIFQFWRKKSNMSESIILSKFLFWTQNSFLVPVCSVSLVFDRLLRHLLLWLQVEW